MWRRHLDGCASLIQSLNIHGSSGGMEQALFWCFARMGRILVFRSIIEPGLTKRRAQIFVAL
jgi:hypothetical protein